MKQIRHAAERGTTQLNWLLSRHSFSFGDYFDPNHMGWGPLRVINDDQLAPGGGFPKHPHRDMEIFSYIISGALAHEDSLGNKTTLTPGRIQLMSAGKGILHSEFNPSKTETTRFLQIWIQPDTIGLQPGYQELDIQPGSDLNAWKLLMTKEGNPKDSSVLRIHQDADFSVVKLEKHRTIGVPESKNRKGYLHIATGRVQTVSCELTTGDALIFENENEIELSALDESELLLFNLPQ